MRNILFVYYFRRTLIAFNLQAAGITTLVVLP